MLGLLGYDTMNVRFLVVVCLGYCVILIVVAWGDGLCCCKLGCL